jgi:hypothetical protein
MFVRQSFFIMNSNITGFIIIIIIIIRGKARAAREYK